MYVYVTVTELPSGNANRLQDLGELPDPPLDQIRDWVLSQVEHELPQLTRIDPRHFWHNDQFQSNRALLSDLVSAGGSVSLELRPDAYCVSVPGEKDAIGVFDPEDKAVDVIHMLLEGRHAGQCCYELRTADGAPLNPEEDLFSQGALPRAEVLAQRNPKAFLLLRRKPIYHAFITSAIAVAAVVGLLLGYLSTRIG